MVSLITEHIDIWTAAQIQKTNGGRGRGKNSNGHSPHGIKKLRELILELAVRGKLVPQDPSDEPARVLLEKIAKEKTRLVKEGKIKKQKPLPEINEDEKPFELPEGWEFLRFGAAFDVTSSKRIHVRDYVPEGVPFFRSKEIGELKKGQPISTDIFISFEKYEDLRHLPGFPNIGDLMLTSVGSIGNTWICDGRNFYYKDGNVTKVGLNQFTDMRYVQYFIDAPLFNFQVSNTVSGTAYNALTIVKLNSLILPLPPLAEQHRIVAKVDELMALCEQLEQQQIGSNATHKNLVETLLATLTSATDQDELAEAWQCVANLFDTLFITEYSVDQLKQTILQLAVMGKLVPQDPLYLPAPQAGKFFVYALECEDKSIYIGQTENILKRWKEHATGKGADWTKKHPPIRLVHWEEYNSREEVIKREKELKTGFGRKWIKRELEAGRTRQAGEPASVLLEKIAKEKERLIKEGKIKKQKTLPEITEDKKPFNLPDSWEWTYVGECFSLMSGTSFNKKKELERGQYIYIKVADMNLEGNEVAITTSSRFLDPTPKELKVLIPAGSIIFPKRGGAIATNKKRFVKNDLFVDLNIMAITPLEGINLNYVYRWLIGIDLAKLNSGTSVPQINNKDISPLLFPIPPLAEQHRIVAKVDELMGVCDNLKSRLNDAQATQVQLADAIVKEAVA